MKRYFIISVLALASCAGSNDQKNEGSKVAEEDTVDAAALTTAIQNKRYCFLLTEGTGNQDTTTIRFAVKGDSVQGDMKWLPHGKDSRIGKLTGTISGDQIKGVWSYMQEGLKDSMHVEFKLEPQLLAQKPLKVDLATGRQETDDAAHYTVIYTQENCGD